MVVIQILPALNYGGVERGTVEMANYLVSQGHTSIVISAGGQMQDKLLKTVEHICLPVGEKSLFSLLKIKQLRWIFKQKKADIVHARSRLPAWLTYRALIKINNNKPAFITTVHGLYSVKKYSSIMARGDRVIAVSNTALRYVKENYSNHLKCEPTLIYRGISLQEFPFGHKPDALWLQSFYEKHHQLLGHKMVLLPGRLTSLKGAKDLVTWLQSNDNDAKLLFTASPKQDSYATKLHRFFKQANINDRIIWIGQQTQMAELYALVDVVLSTSKRPESFGRTVLEALTVGTPVVAYNHGGVGEILTEMFPQGAVELGNCQMLSDKINQLLKDKPQFEKNQTFKLENMLKQTLNLYRDGIHDIQ